MDADAPLRAAGASGLVAADGPLLVLVSGGADSVCLLDVAVRLGARVAALHVNHGLRAGAADDEAHCRDVAAALRVPLAVERLALGGGAGNLQARGREARYALAERHAPEGGPYATAHTLSDQAETVLYRLAVSPGRRALLGMAPRRGRLVRPLLEVGGDETRAYCEARGLAWREDPSNADPRFARARIRHEVLPVLRALNPRVERAVAETSHLLRDEAEALDALVDEELERTAAGGAVALAELGRLPRALARLVLRRLAEDAAGPARAGDGGRVALGRADAERILALAGRPHGGSASLDLGGGLRAVAEYGYVRFTALADLEAPEPVALSVPGAARFGVWRVRATLAGAGGAGPDEAPLEPEALGSPVVVRAWREGDRMRPAGLGGTKTLADLFTDRKVPRALRRTLPVVEVRGEVAWVAGVAVGEAFRARQGAAGVVLSARLDA